MVRTSSRLTFLFRCALLFTVTIDFGCGSTSFEMPSSSDIISYNVFSDGINEHWSKLGFHRGDHVPNFTLYDQDDKKFSLSDQLKLGKPVVLISASYTCDVTRSNIPAIKLLSSKYGTKFRFFIVYVIEPHPMDVPSPYSGDRKIWIALDNIRDHVAASQPKIYQQRVDLSKKWKAEYDINLPILIDNSDNYFWSNFGEAPNMVYVISPNDTVYYKQAWFNKSALDGKLQALAGSH
jgi:hypothetical protein